METRNRKLKKGKRQNGGHERFPGGKHLRKCRKPLPLRRSAPFPGTEQAVPWRAPFGAPRSPSLTLGPVLSPMTPCAAMWSARSPAGHTKKTDVVLKIPNVRWATGKRLTNPLPKPSLITPPPLERRDIQVQIGCIYRLTCHQLAVPSYGGPGRVLNRFLA